MGYYNPELTAYVKKICEVEREVYTVQILISDLNYQIDGLCQAQDIPLPEIVKSGKSPFTRNGGWYSVALLAIPISGIVKSVSGGITIAIILGIIGTVWGYAHQEEVDKRQTDQNQENYEKEKRAEVDRMRQEFAYQKELKKEVKTLQLQQQRLEQAREKLYAQGNIHMQYRGLIPISCFSHYLSTGITNRLEGQDGCYDRFDEDSWRHAVLTSLQQAVRQLQSLRQINMGLYNCLYQSNETLNRIEAGNQRIAGQLDEVRNNTALTEYNTHVSAIANTAMTYMYYDKNYRS